MTEIIDHPPHYGGKDNPYEAIKVIEHYGFGFRLGNAMKYIIRAGRKHVEEQVTVESIMRHAVDDLKKARWYLDREIAMIEKGMEQDAKDRVGKGKRPGVRDGRER